MRPLRPIGVRLAALCALVLLTAMAGLGAAGFYAVDRALLHGADRALADEILESGHEFAKGFGSLEEIKEHLREEAAEERVYQISFRLSSPDGGELARAGPARWEGVSPGEPDAPRAGEPAVRTVRIAGDAHRYRIATGHIETRAVGPAILDVALRLRPEDRLMEGLVERALVAGPIVVLVAFGAGVFLARRALRPIAAIERTARSIGADTTEAGAGRRLPRTGTDDELDRLAATLNDMLARLEAAAARNLAFTGDVAHELRTPLATVRGRIEAVLSAAGSGGAAPAPDQLADALEELARIEALVANLLLLARAEEGRARLPRGPCDLVPLARDAVDFFAPVAEEHGVGLRLAAAPAATVDGDPASLRRIIANLVDNALRYTPRGGEVEVRVEANGDGTGVALEVADTGPGIEPAARERLFERFFRAPEARERNPEGNGLGLALVRAVARAHGGDALWKPGPGGRGSVFRIDLPRQHT